MRKRPYKALMRAIARAARTVETETMLDDFARQ
jgi:hypothetical protein